MNWDPHSLKILFLDSQFSGLKEYVLAKPALNFETLPTVVRSQMSDGSITGSDYDDGELQDEFYDATAADSSSSEDDSDNDKEVGNKVVLIKILKLYVWKFTYPEL